MFWLDEGRAHDANLIAKVRGYLPGHDTDGLRIEMGSWAGFKMAVNYGWNKVRFPAPVLVGSRVRCTAQVVELTEVGGGWHQVVTRFTVESEGVEKPVCVADSVGRLLAEDAA